MALFAQLGTGGLGAPVLPDDGVVHGLAGLASPMVGRDAELATLLQSTAALQAGLGRVAVVIGEPGLGKTRLIAEWQTAAGADASAATAMQWAAGHCVSHGQGLAYHLVIDLLRSLIGVSAAAEVPETHAALRRRMDELFGDGAIDLYPFLGHMLGVPLEGAALGRVLAGIQVPPSDDAAFRRYLAELNYPWIDESGNQAFRLFLR